MKKLNIDGYIIDDQDRWLYDMFEVPYVTLPIMRAFLAKADGDEIELVINCFGGDCWSAASIYAELRAYKGKSTARVIGLSASASSFLMLGCDRVIASPMAQIMIHNAQTAASGDHREMAHTAAVLQQVDETIRNAYEIKTGKSRDALKKYMDAETWLTPQDALEVGIIDEIDLKDGEVLTAPKASMLTPSRVSAVFNPDKMHAVARRLGIEPPSNAAPEPEPEPEPIVEPEPAPEEVPAEDTNDSGGVSRPVSDTQRQWFNEIKKKLYSR